MNTTTLPIAIIGAGPVGMAAAAQLIERGLTPIIFERGATVASAMNEWAHGRPSAAEERAALSASGRLGWPSGLHLPGLLGSAPDLAHRARSHCHWPWMAFGGGQILATNAMRDIGHSRASAYVES
jgi:glycine/D-amino acid oxidase-like deaminating enzyme